MTTPQIDDFWTDGDTGDAILADPPTLLDPDVGEPARDLTDHELSIGIDAINEARRYLMPRTLTLG